MWRYKSFSSFPSEQKFNFLSLFLFTILLKFSLQDWAATLGKKMFCLSDSLSVDSLPRHTDISYMGHWSDKHFMTMISPDWTNSISIFSSHLWSPVILGPSKINCPTYDELGGEILTGCFQLLSKTLQEIKTDQTLTDMTGYICIYLVLVILDNCQLIK